MVEAGRRNQIDGVLDRLEKLSAPGILIFFLLMTFCAVDYLMTLEPHWYSTVYGFMIVIGWCLTAMSLVVATLTVCAKYAPMRSCDHEEASARSRQADVRAGHALGVSELLAVADYLVG